MSTTTTPDRFTTRPDEQTLASAVTAHQELPGRIHIVLVRQVVGF
ncbi:MAG: hypothetical protein ACLQB1_35185 [Streptosporangiaceae bacterium]